MLNVNNWLGHLAHNYVLIVVGAIIFFAFKSILGIMTYHHYNKELEHLHKKIDLLLAKRSDE